MFLDKIWKRSVDCSKEINEAKVLMNKADMLVIGIGSGLSASCGIEYSNYRFVKEIFPDYYRMGYKKIAELEEMYHMIMPENAKAYWGFWSRLIKAVRYDAEVGTGYRDLLRCIRNKNYFIYTTNVDGQVEKAGFDQERLFAPNGDYQYLQCSSPCCNKLYDSGELLDGMIKSLGGNLEIAYNKIPYCPECGNYLVPNIKGMEHFVWEPHMKHKDAFENFIRTGEGKKVVFMELGMGETASETMRQYFKEVAKASKEAKLIRINKQKEEGLQEFRSQVIDINGNLNEVIAQLAEGVVTLESKVIK